MNPDSRYMETTRIEGLTLYDIERKPRQVVSRDEAGPIVCKIATSALNIELTCPICLGICKQTTIVKECLHRFCRDCIEKCLRLGKKECPQCRVHVPSRRSLRANGTFDELINILYPNLKSFEEQQERRIEQDNKSNQFQLSETLQRAKEKQLVHRRSRPARSALASSRGRGKRRRGYRGRGSPSSDEEDDFDEEEEDDEDDEEEEADGQGVAASGRNARNAADAPPGLVDASTVLSSTLNAGPVYRFALRRHPHETRLPQLKRPYIKTSGAFTVRHMKKLLQKRLQTYLDLEFFIFHRQPIVLPELLTLESIIKRAFPDGDGELIIFYRVAS